MSEVHGLLNFMTTDTGTFDPASGLRSAAGDGDGAGARGNSLSGGRPSRCSETAPSGIAFGASSANLEALEAALVQLEAAEQLSRESAAARVTALAEIDRVARLEADTELNRRSIQRAAEDTLAFRQHGQMQP